MSASVSPLGSLPEKVETSVSPTLNRLLTDGTLAKKTPDQEETTSPEDTSASPARQDAPGGMRFWLIMFSLMMSTILSALDLVRPRFVIRTTRTSKLN